METRTAKIGNLIVTGYSTDYVFQTVEKTGDFYESELLKRWTPLLDSPKRILDIGANLGNHTLFWGTQLNSVQIIAVEPFEDNYKLLCENIEKNNLEKVIPLKVALGEKDGIAAVKQFNPENYGGTAFAYVDDGSSEEYAAKVRTADNVVSELQIPRVDFAKIDTEGFELSVLKGMQQIIDRDHPILWVEVCKETVADVYALLREKGYNLVEMVAANTLFIPTRKAQGRNISLEFLLSENMTLLSKVNTYYSNYETSKKWLAAKEAELQERETKIFRLQKESADLQEKQKRHQQLQEQVTAISEKYKKAEENYQTVKQWLDTKNTQLQDCRVQNETLKREKDVLLEEQKRQVQQIQNVKEAELRTLRETSDRAIQTAVQQVLQESAETVRRNMQSCDEKVRQLEKDHSEKLLQLERSCEIRIQKINETAAEELQKANEAAAEELRMTKETAAEELQKAAEELKKAEEDLQNAAEELQNAKKAATEELRKANAAAEEKLRALEFQRAKENQEARERLNSRDRQLALLSEDNATLLSQVEQLRQQLRKDEKMLQEEETFLQQTKQQLLLLSTKLQQAQRQNKVYEEKLNKVYGTWYGRIVLKTYKFLKKIKNFIIKK